MFPAVTPLRRFRFGLHFWTLPADSWIERVQRYERLGFSSITFTDHQVVAQWEPMAALGAVAAVTESIAVGPLVLDMALRNPVLTAKSAATLELLSAGRLELGLGAGYVQRNFAASGVPFERPADRIARLGEGLSLMRRLWTESSTTMHGRFYVVTDAPMAAASPVSPTVLIGGGGRKVMRLGGQVADVVSMIPKQDRGEWSVADSLADATVELLAKRASWVRGGAEEAGRDPADVELHTLVTTVAVGDNAGRAMSRASAEAGVPLATLADSTLALMGTGAEVRERLQEWRSRAGVTYVSLFDPGDEQIEYLASEVVSPLGAV
jgi:probable F420-dependent oxidoreductase